MLVATTTQQPWGKTGRNPNFSKRLITRVRRLRSRVALVTCCIVICWVTGNIVMQTLWYSQPYINDKNTIFLKICLSYYKISGIPNTIRLPKNQWARKWFSIFCRVIQSLKKIFDLETFQLVPYQRAIGTHYVPALTVTSGSGLRHIGVYMFYDNFVLIWLNVRN